MNDSPSSIPIPPDQYVAAVGGGNFSAIGNEFFDLLVRHGGLLPAHDVLDIGCGCGRMAVPLTTYLAPTAQYRGFDILEPLVSWCTYNISSRFSNFEFSHVNLANSFYDSANLMASSAKNASHFHFNYPDNRFDFVLATSVFTHLNTSEASNYLDEVSRVLKPGGRAFLTFFLMNEDYNWAVIRQFPMSIRFDFGGFPYWIYNTERPEWAVAHDESFIFKKIRSVGLLIDTVSFGSWKGRNGLTFQDIIMLSKAS